ncbi:aquaporin-8a.1 [Osmerus mordax]|uniref:aquaporin-8a.1 n=1 Tax=Osmerus mordax TaxID=8014 RepID=UPI00350F1671
MSVTESKSELFTVCGVDVVESGAQAREAPRSESSVFEHYIQPCLAELLGTALFVFVGCVSVVGNAGLSGCLQPALAHGLALGVLIMVFGEISGGHLNPAVTLCVALCGGMKLALLAPYVLAQLLGSMVGAALAKAVSPSANFYSAAGGAFDVVQTSGAVGAATVAEMLMTLVLTLVVCMGAVNAKTKTPLAPLCIGLVVTANILASAFVSGGCMNPARAFGPAVAAKHWEHHWVYWVGPICGALLTVSMVRLFFGDQKTRVIWK